MNDTENLRQELAELSPILSKMKKEGDGRQVPKDYFKNLPDQILQHLDIGSLGVAKPKIVKTERWKALWDKLTWLLQPRSVMAFASIVLLIFAGLFLLNRPTDNQNSVSLSDIPLEELEIFLRDNIGEYDPETLVKGEENLIKDGFGKEDGLDDYLEGIIEESELEDLL